MATLTDEEWDAYKRKFEKSYADEAEDAMRRDLVNQRKLKIDEHNKRFEAGLETYTQGINHFADFTEEDNKRMFGCGRITNGSFN